MTKFIASDAQRESKLHGGWEREFLQIFRMMSDRTPNVSYQNQLSEVLRYVKMDGSRVWLVESFIDFTEVKGERLKI